MSLYKSCFFNDADIDKISSTKKNRKYFIGCSDDFKIKPFSIFLPKASTYIKSYDGETKLTTKFTKHLIVNPSKFKFLKTRIRSYNDKVTNFHDKDIAEVRSNHTCLALILIDFVLKEIFCMRL